MEIQLKHESTVPLYEQIISDLRFKIEAGEYEKGSRIPTEDELSEIYGVSRITVRRAITELCDVGLIEKRHGKGTFVSSTRIERSFGITPKSFTEICHSSGSVPSAKVLEAGIMIPEIAYVCDGLQLKPGEQAVHITRLRYVNKRPLVFEENYFTMDYADLLNIDLEHSSIYEYLRTRRHIELQRTSTRVRICRTDARMSKLLELPKNTPRMEMQGLVLDGVTGKPVHTSYQLGYDEDFVLIV